MLEAHLITEDQVIKLILEACPSFRDRYQQSEDRTLLYIIAGDFARHLLNLEKEQRTEEFTAVSEILERLHLEGTPSVKELATIGFLEGIQNVWRNSKYDPEVFVKWLKPETWKWWNELNDFWEGKIPYVGAGLHNKTRDTGAK